MVLGQVVYQNKIQAPLRNHEGRKGFPGSFLNSPPFPEGEEKPPLAVAVSDNRLQQVEAFLSYILGIHLGELSFNFHMAGRAL